MGKYKGLNPGDTYTHVVNGVVHYSTYQPPGSRAQWIQPVTRLAREGLRYKEIAKELGISHHTVRYVIMDNDIPYAFTGKLGRPRKKAA